MNEKELGNLRKEYALQALSKDMLLSNPIDQFNLWFSAAVKLEDELEANAMVLATVNTDLQPSARVVLLKEITTNGFVFFTNYLSQKGLELAQNQKCALTFWWHILQQQVRIEGKVHKVDQIKSERYFRSRPLGSQRSAIISPQSQVIPDRNYLENKLRESEGNLGGGELEKPNDWGGYEVIPHLVEFWQGRANRLHDRFRYTPQGDSWKIDRLAP